MAPEEGSNDVSSAQHFWRPAGDRPQPRDPPLAHLGFWFHWELYSAQSEGVLSVNWTLACSGFPKRKTLNLAAYCRLSQTQRNIIMKSKIHILNLSWILKNGGAI